ncbi:MAG: hypothetical protein CMP22_07320 [Rickettsiales bacterium]|nr:hypothetical protein [Rickettsiales bacterium]
MTFYDRLRKASFKGFEFSLSDESKEFGRDVVKHKILNASAPSYEDVGQKETSFTLEIAIGGNDNFLEDAQAFEALLSEKGSGRLVLPHDGEMTAVVTSARRRTTTKEIGIVYFTVTFDRDEEKNDTATVSTSTILKQRSNTSFNSALTDFTKSYRANVPDFVHNASLTEINGIATDLALAISRVKSDFIAPDFNVENTAVFADQIVSMFQGLLSFEAPVNYTIATQSASNTPTANQSLEIAKALIDVAGTAQIEEVAGATATQSLRSSNSQAIHVMAKVSALSAAADAVSYAEFTSKEEAITVRDDLLSDMGELRSSSGALGWNDSYISLGGLMAAVNDDINTGLGRLPSTALVQNNSVLSSLALAYRLYGHDLQNVVSKSDDLIKRNRVVHPSFIPIQDLEVLIDA